MTARGMSNGDHSRQIKIELRRDRSHMMGAGRDILECAWPTAARISKPPVLDIPCGESGCRQGVTSRSNIFKIVFRTPESAMDHDRNGVWTPPFRQPQISELKLIRP